MKGLAGHVIRDVHLRTTDALWVEHLTTMQHLRTGVGLQGYAQKDPLSVYTAEGHRLFQMLLQAIDEQTVRVALRAVVVEQPSETVA
jgi:preprotein translocase subunit SecA